VDIVVSCEGTADGRGGVVVFYGDGRGGFPDGALLAAGNHPHGLALAGHRAILSNIPAK
jgi:hypothetical protein